ncbi:hypothetical protein BH23ACI1_BH23ACI1_13150 [soil metagenome]|nr:hypothetical protein [Acidobacteriota bacterium]
MFRILRWSAVPAIALALLTSTVPAEAQVTATAVMKSGERHQGQFPWTRVDKGEFALRKSVHDQLRVNINEVAYVDFGGTSDTQVNLTGSQHAVVLRDGNVLRGQVIEMGHTNPEDQTSDYIVTFRDQQGQERRLPVAQVGRVYFSAPTATATTGTEPATGAAQAGGAVTVQARQQWTATGMNVQKGENIRFTTTGQIQLSSDPNDVAQAAGALSQRMATSAPLPRSFAGALIGRIGPNGQPFAIGNQTSVQMPSAGQLFLGINDDDVNDNQGEFRVEIQRATGSPIRRR